ncbi:MAG: phosphonate-binding protein [Pseudorhodoplanes sp.]|nr:phosphonate-binding protein [Pseudorhodoplanes sp.]
MKTSSDRRFPKGALIGAGALVAFAMTAASTARLTGIGATREPQADPVFTRELRFEDRRDGAVTVLADERVIDILEPGTSGFVRNVMRGLARERLRNDGERERPFRLTKWADGRLSIEDPLTGRRVDLGAFGAANTAAFARLMANEGEGTP